MKKNPDRLKRTDKLPIRKALYWILFSTLLISGTAGFGIFYYQHIRSLRAQDSKYNIVAIVQTTTSKQLLKTAYFTELLNLSVDRPGNLYRFSAKEATRKLLDSPLIKSAQVKKIKPGMLHIDYLPREPIAFLIDYTNTAIDDEAYPFPFHPFFTPKRLPEIYLGLSTINSEEQTLVEWNGWGIPIAGIRIKLALTILNEIAVIKHQTRTHANWHVQRIDVSNAYAPSYGHRQIVLVIEEYLDREIKGQPTLFIFPRILRLNTANYKASLENYFAMREKFQNIQESKLTKVPQANETAVLRAPTTIVDLRLTQLAYIEEEGKKAQK